MARPGAAAFALAAAAASGDWWAGLSALLCLRLETAGYVGVQGAGATQTLELELGGLVITVIGEIAVDGGGGGGGCEGSKRIRCG